MTNEIKFTEEELKSIADLQHQYEKSIFTLGELQIRRYMVDDEIDSIKKDEHTTKAQYLELQKTEESLLQSLSDKYGDGVLNAKTGTFTPSKKQ